MTSSSGSAGTPFPKWQIAVALGATGAIGLGYWYMKHYSIDKAKSHSKTSLLQMGKKSTSSLDEISEVESVAKTPLELALQHKTDGNEQFKNGSYDKAIACYTKAIEDCPIENLNELATFYQNRAAAYEHLKKHSSVIDDCTKALGFKPTYIKALYRRARAYEAVKNWNDALDDISALCLLQEFQDQSSLLMADRVLKELGKKHAKEEMARKVPVIPSKHFIGTYFSSFSEDPAYNLIKSDTSTLENKPVSENAHENGTESTEDEEETVKQELKGFMRARKAFLDGNYEDIIPACTEEIDCSESESQYKFEALLLRATFLLLSGSHDSALADLEAIIANEQADIKCRVNALIKRASLHVQLENPEACLMDFSKAAELGPNISDVYHHRGQVNLLMDRTDAASSDFDRAVELNPDFPLAYVQKCYADYRQALYSRNITKVQKCINNFANAAQKYPKCQEVFTMYGQVLADREQFKKAEEYYDKALEIDPTNATIYVHKGLLQIQWKSDTVKATELMKVAIEKDPLCEFAYETLATVEVQRGNLEPAVELFDKAIKLAKTELEMIHLFSLKDAAMSQLKMSKKLNLTLPQTQMFQ